MILTCRLRGFYLLDPASSIGTKKETGLSIIPFARNLTIHSSHRTYLFDVLALLLRVRRTEDRIRIRPEKGICQIVKSAFDTSSLRKLLDHR